jgi:porin
MINEKPHGNHSFEHQESKPPFSLTRIEKEISVNIREIVSVLCILVFLGAFALTVQATESSPQVPEGNTEEPSGIPEEPEGIPEEPEGIPEELEGHFGSNFRPLLSTDEVENQIIMDRRVNPLHKSIILAPIKKWKNQVAEETGFHWSLDYTALFTGVSESPGEDSAGSGMVRFYGFWDIVNRGGPNKGSLNFKVENRHSYTDIPPSSLGFQAGYLGLIGAPFSDQGGRLTNLEWKQYFANGDWVFVGGFLYVLGYVDVYAISSPWTGFTNFMFSTGSGAMDIPNDAALGAGLGGLITENIYVHAGFADANSDPTDPFNDVWKGNDFFKWVEIGYSPKGQASFFSQKAHFTYWQVDERADSTPKGWGLNASWHTTIADKWFPFIRGGYTKDSGSLLDRSISAGVSYQHIPRRGVIGLGFNLGRPNETSYGDLDDQYTTELFWRFQVTTELAVTPTIQYIRDPALNPDEDSLWAFGLRVRVVL